MLRSVAIHEVQDRIRFENPWWHSGQVDPYFAQMPRRAYFQPLYTLLRQIDVQRSIVLMGPRRVGKTVMLYHCVQELLSTGFPPRKILFITVENPIYNQIGLEQLFAYGRDAIGNPDDLEGWFVFFDEIQYLKDWDIHLKSLVDSYRNTRFVVSGSAAAALKFKSQESGAGRFSDFMLPPLTFYEFIQMQDLGHLIRSVADPSGLFFFESTDIRRLNSLFIDYINYGGYPEAIFSESVRNNPERFIRQDVVDKVLLRDLPSVYGIQDVQELNSLFTTIAYNSSHEFSLETLGRQSGLPKNTIKRYLEYLEAAFLIRIVKRIDQSGKRFQRDNFFKIHLSNPSLRAALFSPLQASDEAMGQMTETAIFAQWMHSRPFRPWYARWSQGEVDLVGLDSRLRVVWALEIKWSDRYVRQPAELRSLIRFCKENKLAEASVTSIGLRESLEYEGIRLDFVPASVYTYTIGANTIAQLEDAAQEDIRSSTRNT